MIQELKHIITDINSVDKKGNFGIPIFLDKHYIPFKFDMKNVHLIEESEITRLSAIDAGRQEILTTNNFSIHVIRIYANLFKAKRRLRFFERNEHFLLLRFECRNHEIFIKAKLYPDVFGELLFNINDPTLKDGNRPVGFEKIANTIMRFLEWHYAKHLCVHLKSKDIILKDGTLQTSVVNENKFAHELYKEVLEKNILLCSIAKHSTIMTTTGRNMIDVIKELGDKKYNTTWYYYPIVKINHPAHKAEMLVAKLHENSSKVFRIEIFKDQFSEQTMKMILYNLMINQDLKALGYPYALVDAHRFAHVKENEAKYYRDMLRALGLKEKTIKEAIQ